MKKTAIIIINYKTPWYTTQCIKSIFKYTKDFHLILVQNSQDDASIKMGRRFQNRYSDQITLIENNTNLGFVGGVNSAYKKAMEFEQLCLLNNDTIVSKHWLTELQNALDKPNVVQVFPDSNQYRPSNFWSMVSKLPLGMHKLRRIQPSIQPRRDQNATQDFFKLRTIFEIGGGFCTLTRSTYFKNLGYILDPNIIHGYWDDFDLRMYLSQFGIAGYTPLSYVFHFVNISINKILPKRQLLKEQLKYLNGLYVMDKWSRDLQSTSIDKENMHILRHNEVYSMMLQYFGLVAIDPTITEYIQSLPAKEIGDKFLG